MGPCMLTAVVSCCDVAWLTLQVLPRYQRLVSQLYDRLRVVALDEVVPALDKCLAQAAAAAAAAAASQ